MILKILDLTEIKLQKIYILKLIYWTVMKLLTLIFID